MEPVWRAGQSGLAVPGAADADGSGVAGGRATLRVALVDDHADFLRWARATLAPSPWIEVVGETTDPETAVGLVREAQPDLVLIDFEMPGITGFEVARRIKEDTPGVSVLLMSMHDSAYFEVLARLAGARGFLPKTRFSAESIATLLDAKA